MTLRILIVQAEPLIALDLEDLLVEDGHEVAGIAANAVQMLALARSPSPIDVALVDLDVAEGATGMELARCLREDHDVPVLLVTAWPRERSRAMSLAWDPAGFVGKPFQAQEIERALARL